MLLWKRFIDVALEGLCRVKSNATLKVDGALLTPPIQVTSSARVLTSADYGHTVVLDRAAGVAVTLPAASGSGGKFKVVVKTTVTSNSNTIKVANASDTMTGMAHVLQDGGDTSVAFETAATSDTITGNGTTTGGIKGDIWEIEDVAANLWSVRGTVSATGTEATPFSATVA
jgi:hypothetical protein